MMKNSTYKTLSALFLVIFLGSCADPEGLRLPSLEIQLRDFSSSEPFVSGLATATQPTIKEPTATPITPEIPTSQPTNTPFPDPLWIDPSVPAQLRENALEWNLAIAENVSVASLQLGLALESDTDPTTWIYALVAPFPTILDGVTLAELEAAWNDSLSGPLPDSPLWMTDSTLNAFTARFGEAEPGSVKTVPEAELLDLLWDNQPAWGFVPFESLDPRLKVLTIDGESPVKNDFDESSYPLSLGFKLVGNKAALFDLPRSNRDPSKLTVVIMTGVTAMVRATAVRMEIAGLDYPAWNIGDTLEAADITHISNEVPFYTGCPYPDPRQEDLVFCSNPKYIELLEIVGTDVVELTGNHFQDYGSPAALQTLDLYNERGWPYYGGGANLEDSRKPALITHNGNRFAFVGCNPVGPGIAWATEDEPGAASCDDYEWLKAEIANLTERGYIVIATFQYFEYYVPEPTDQHRSDFRAIADAGATIVNGSQAHIPQAMEYYHGSFIHYGLGSLFFDNMAGPSRREFIDRHVFYAGQYISTELITAMLEDFARPRLMRADERQAILTKIFDASGW